MMYRMHFQELQVKGFAMYSQARLGIGVTMVARSSRGSSGPRA